MCGSFARMLRDGSGMAALEFALFLPFFLFLTAGVIDMGRALDQAVAIEKGLRAGALFAARNELPLTAETAALAGNLVRTGSLAGSNPVLASGWADSTAELSITTRTYAAAEGPLTVLALSAAVPFEPLLAPLLARFGVAGFTIRLSHEQAHLGV